MTSLAFLLLTLVLLLSLTLLRGGFVARAEARILKSIDSKTKQSQRREPDQVRGLFFSPPRCRGRKAMAPDVVIFDTTLRDGEQAPGNAMSPEAKLRLARQLDALGVDVIEAGFPAASQGDWRGVQRSAAAVHGPTIAALARCHDRDIDAAGEALQPAQRKRIHVFIATSDLHLEQKLRIDRATCIERVCAAVRRARGYTGDVEFSAEDATRSDLDFLCSVVAVAIAEGATTINLPDTGGYAMPAEYAALFRAVRERVPAAQQGHRRPQRVCARGRHSPARGAAERADLRDHRARDGRRGRVEHRAWKALRPSRARAPLSPAGIRARREHARTAVRGVHGTRRQETADPR